jgi:galactose oxidase-like protein/Big-like domain-containing protein/glyoxal oxidase-like protein/fibronectin type III domain protein
MSGLTQSRRYRWAIAISAGLLFALFASSASGAVTVDKTVTTHQSAAAKTIVSPALTTSAPGDLLLAFISSDGPSGSGSMSFSGVTGGGLTWHLVRRANAQAGTAEIWAASAAGVVSNATVTATRASGSYAGSITVVALSGADLTAPVASAAASAASGAPTVTVTTTRAGSWVWGVGNDWDRAVARTVGSGQTKVDEFLASVGDTFWVQRQNAAAPLPGTAVTLNDTAPTSDRWNLAAVEVLPAVTDTQPPSVPTGLTAGTVTATKVPLSWTASTDDQGVAGYRVFRGGSQVGEVAGTAFTDTTVAASTTYTYTVKAFDGAGNVSEASEPLIVTTPEAADTTPPTVSMTAPAEGTVSGTIKLAATASDASGIAAVQFLVDGSAVGAEDTVAPYELSWNSTSIANGEHKLSARARDGAGNTATSAAVTVTVSNGSGSEPSQVGQWGPLIPLPAVAIHSALLPSGKILLWQGDFSTGGQQYVLNPQTGNVVQIPDAKADLFCAGQAVLADGRIMVIGGTKTDGGLGVANITTFDWHNETWGELTPMNFRRWYATGTTLADGKVLVTSGDDQSATDVVETPEIYSPATNTWTSLTAAKNYMPVYPFIYQLPDGRIVHLGGSEQATASEVLDLTTNKWTTFDSRVIDGGSIANYAPGKFIKAGSASDDGFSGNSLKTAYTLNMNEAGAIWQPTASMAFPRSFLNLTNLPDGTVLATGGDTDKSGENNANAVLQAEDWNPGSGSWTTYAPMSAPRLYHSVAVLLPDGRVYVAGGGGTPLVTDQKSAQIFSPPYLFKGPRPTVSSAPATLEYGSTAFVGTPDASSIARVSLIRTGSVTHAFDENARATQLSFTQTAGGINVTIPSNRNDIPPGYYMLFIVNGEGVPSIAPFVRFPAPYENTSPPTAPTELVATGGEGTAALKWGAATDDQGVSRYNIHRSSTPGFTPTAANKVGQTTGLTFTDTNVPAGTWYYEVTAEDAASNVGPPSNEASATVTAVANPTLALDGQVTTRQSTNGSTIASPPLSTTKPGDLLLAFISSDGPSSGAQTISAVSGGGLTWSLRTRANGQPGTAEVWQAVAPAALTNVAITATRAKTGYQGSITVAAFSGADTAINGANATANATTGAPSVSLTTTKAGSWVWGVGEDWDRAITHTPAAGQTIVDQFLSPSGDTFWSQRQTSTTAAAGTSVPISDTAPTSDRWDLAAVEVRPAGP